jgi:hypothetical protein
VKVDVKTAAFVGALQQPRTQTLPSTNSVMTTITNQTDAAVTVKYRDVEGAEYSKELREHSPISVAIRMDPNSHANPIKWSAYVAAKICDSGTVAVSSGTGTIEVTKCKRTCELSMDKANCELQRDVKDAEQTRKRRDQARADLASARSAYNSCMTTASKSPIKTPLVDVCRELREKVNKLVAEITADDLKLGEQEPGGPLRTETVLNTTPPPATQDDTKKKLEEEARKKLRGCVPSGSPDAPANTQGNTGGVLDGHAGGCTFQTNVGGGRK